MELVFILFSFYQINDMKNCGKINKFQVIKLTATSAGHLTGGPVIERFWTKKMVTHHFCYNLTQNWNTITSFLDALGFNSALESNTPTDSNIDTGGFSAVLTDWFSNIPDLTFPLFLSFLALQL